MDGKVEPREAHQYRQENHPQQHSEGNRNLSRGSLEKKHGALT